MRACLTLPSLMAICLASPTPNMVETKEVARRRRSEVWTAEQEAAAGIVKNWKRGPHLLDDSQTMPDSFTWCDKDGVNYCTATLNQHLPQFCA